jgi:ADP-ribose pyrophosphatase YjhB (NUDIX family)
MYRKGVSALIVNENNEFLLVNLESFEEKYFAVPGGGIERGETLENAVYREMREELNIEKGHLRLVGWSEVPVKFKFRAVKLTRGGKEYEGSERYFFGFRFLGVDDEIKLQEEEVRTYKWVPFAQLKDYLLFENQLQETSEKIEEIFSRDRMMDQREMPPTIH